MILRPYQFRGKHDIYREWEISDILFYVLATGGGKTVQFVDLINDFLIEGKRILLIAHREKLIRQAWNTLFGNGIFAGVIQASVTYYDDPVTGNRYMVLNPALPAQVCSIQTVQRRSELPDADLIVVDEAHHVEKDNSYGKILNMPQFRDAKILLVSATPYRLSGEGFEDIVTGKITRLIVNSTLRTLQLDGWLCPIRYFFSFNPHMETARLSKGDYREDDARKHMELAPLVKSYKDNAAGMQGMIFAINVAHSLDIKAMYDGAGIPCEHIDANTPDAVRDAILRDYEAGFVKAVTNCDIYSEGADFPICQFVQLASPTKSLSKYLQRIGRSTRALPGIVDAYHTAEERKVAIAASEKPCALVLDNAGCWLDHTYLVRGQEPDWQYYFRGAKYFKKEKSVDEMMQMEIFVCVDDKGNVSRHHNAKEIEGLELVEVTVEVQRKVINIKSIYEFDRLHKKYCKTNSCKAPGLTTVNKFVEYCDKAKILVTSEIWKYMHDKLVTDIATKIANTRKNYMHHPTMYPGGPEQTIANITIEGVSHETLTKKYKEYYVRNKTQLDERKLQKQ